MKRLRDIADLLEGVANRIDYLDEAITTEQAWEELGEDLAKLEAIMPNHPVLTVARTRWFARGISSLEDDAPITTVDTLNRKLTKNLLGDFFDTLFERFLAYLKLSWYNLPEADQAAIKADARWKKHLPRKFLK